LKEITFFHFLSRDPLEHVGSHGTYLQWAITNTKLMMSSTVDHQLWAKSIGFSAAWTAQAYL
jgi:hypothetical protein